jgi:hypothetical protein
MLDILSTIGNTPLVELTNIIKGKSPIRLLAKVEGFNPGGSVKDRAALYMISSWRAKKPQRHIKAPEITQTSPPPQKEDHEKYSAEVSAAIKIS